MGRKAGVSSEAAVAIISEFIENFKTCNLPPWSSEVWRLMSERCRETGGTWSAHNFYIHVRENRRNDLQKAREQCNILISPNVFDISSNSINERDVSMRDDDPNDKDFSLEPEAQDLHTFQICVSNQDWKTMRGVLNQNSSDKNRSNLLKDVWEHKLSDLIYSQTTLPCAYVFDGVRIYENPSSLHYLRIKGQCKSKECRNPLFVYLYDKPGDSDFILVLRTRNTVFSKHPVVQRPLRGVIRKNVGGEIFLEGSSNWRRRRIAETTELGHAIPPTIPNLRTLHHSKSDFIDKQLNVGPADGIDVVSTIWKMQNSAKYATSMLDLNTRPFYISYSTPSQRHAYSRYQQIARKHTTVGIDGSGAGAKRLVRLDGTKSGFIFLYTIIIHFDDTIMPIHQLLTESQHTNTFERCLRVWITPPKGLPRLPKPSQLICDDSRALLNGCCLALNDQSIHTFVETCFMYAINHPEFPYRPEIQTLIRLDVFHLLKMVKNWDCVKKLQLKSVQKFFIYCMGLLYDCQILSVFEKILVLVFTIGIHEFQDQMIMAVPNGTVKDARQVLENIISERKEDFFKNDIEVLDDQSEKKIDEEFLEEVTTEVSRSHIREWVNKVLVKASMKQGSSSVSDPNAFYAPDFIGSLVKLSYEFPLWTGVGFPFFVQHGTTSYNEGYFNLWKNNERKNYSKCMRIDKCIKLHLKNCDDQTRIFDSKLTGFVSKGQPLESPVHKKVTTKDCEEIDHQLQYPEGNVEISPASSRILSSDSDSDAIDNWRNKGDEKKLKKIEKKFNTIEEPSICQLKDPIVKTSQGYYFKANPEIAFQNNLSKNVQNGWLLLNGNSLNPIKIEENFYFIKNTCHFDVLVQILMCMAFDNNDYKSLLNQKQNDTYHLIYTLLGKGLSPEIYQQRGEILKEIFKDRIVISQKTKYRIFSYSIDTLNNSSETWMKIFPDIPSVFITDECPNCGVSSDSRSTVQVHHHNIYQNGFQALNEELFNYFQSTEGRECKQCREPACTRTISPNYHIHIELDIRSNLNLKNGKKTHLREFPKRIPIHGVYYRLTGIVGYQNSHYVAYCRRANNRWQMYSDTEINVKACTEAKFIEPHIAIYMVENFVLSTWFSEGEAKKTNAKNEGNVELSVNETYDNEPAENLSNIIPPSVETSLEKALSSFDPQVFHDCFSEVLEHCHYKGDTSNDSNVGIHDVQNSPKFQRNEGNELSSAMVGPLFLIEEASNFDCLLQIFSVAGLEDIEYREAMKLCDNNILNLVEMYMQRGLVEEFRLKRVMILKEVFPEKIYPFSESESEKYILNLRENIVEIWDRCMKSAPSLYKQYKCNHCTPYVEVIPHLKIDNKNMLKNRLENLNKSLDIHTKLFNVKCSKCTGSCTVEFTYNFHVFIPLLSTNSQNIAKKYKLKNIPTTIQLQCSYRLSCVAAYYNGSYQTFHHTMNNRWIVFQKSFSSGMECPDTTVITPHAALYIISQC